MSAVDSVELEVRELVRRRGLDPVSDRIAVRRLVDEVVADYDERSLTSALPPLSDTRQAARSVYDAVAGFGPLQRHLDDPTIEEIWIYERLTEWSARSRRSGIAVVLRCARPGAFPASPRLRIECRLHDYAFAQPLATRHERMLRRAVRTQRSACRIGPSLGFSRR